MSTENEHVTREESIVIRRKEKEIPQLLNSNNLSPNKLKRLDSLDFESGNINSRSHHHHHGNATTGGGWVVVLQLAFQSIGVVYGDIGTSPLYVFSSTFTDGIKHDDDILGVLSLIFYTISLIPLIKYVFIVLRANDNGDGGTFALYSLLCRHAKVGLMPSQELEDRDVSTFQSELPNNGLERASKLKTKLENSNFAKYFLLFATMLGTSMVIGDGVLTPCITVLSAMSGIKEATTHITEDAIVWASVGILVFIFMVQRFGTDKVGYTFAPIICLWFSFIAVIGLHNLIKYDPTVVKAINPKYIIDYFKRNKDQAWISLGGVVLAVTVLSAMSGIKEATTHITEDAIVWASVAILVFIFMVQRFGTDKVGYSFAPIICLWFSFIAVIGLHNLIKYDPTVVKAINIIDYFKRNKEQAWISLGGVVLAITGTEALFADVGHFSVRSIQISMCTVTYPALILAYTGQASFLRKNNDLVFHTFFKSIPGPLYWPTFVVALLASIIASQAMISGSFSIIQHSLSLGCFPRVKIVHTSTKYSGQIYIPEINYILMVACVFVTLGFRTTLKIGNAYGIAVVFVMTLRSSFLVLIMILIWKTHILLIIAYVLIIGSIELVYLSSVLYKFDQGGYLPLAFAMVLMAIMFVWNDVYRRKYYFELEHKISPVKVKDFMEDTHSHQRLPGLAIFYSELVHGIPPIFKHYVANVPALHSVLIFVSFKSLPISKVPIEERFLFRRVEPKDLQVFRCVVRYGYKDVRNEQESFERLLIQKLKEYIREDFYIRSSANPNRIDNGHAEEEGSETDKVQDESVNVGITQEKDDASEREIESLDKAWQCGVVHLVGEHEVMAGKGANIFKRVLIDYAYNFLKKNVRQSNKVFDIPQKRMLKVGMTYQL